MRNTVIISSLAQAAIAKGISYVVVGDFGSIQDLTQANAVFDALNLLKKNAVPGSREDFSFFVTTGDNLYPNVAQSPTTEELDAMVGLFSNSTRPAIRDLPIFPTRGNHDCYFDDMLAEVKLREKHPTWQMDGLWYEKQFEVGNGKKIALLMVDSCLLICDALMKAPEGSKHKLLGSLDEDSRKVATTVCEQKDYQ